MRDWATVAIVGCVIVLSGCVTKYDKEYEQKNPKTWERASSCPTPESLCACRREPAEDCTPNESHVGDLKCKKTSKLFRTSVDQDPCAREALKRERDYYPSLRQSSGSVSEAGALPLLGVALSGGGARSASTSIGFLKALDTSGILARTDLISSVSGGSYASYWFFSHLYNAGTELDIVRSKEVNKNEGRYAKLFAPDGRFQKSVGIRSHLATKKQAEPALELEMLGQVLTWLPTIPLHWLTAGLFDRKGNMNPLTYWLRVSG